MTPEEKLNELALGLNAVETETGLTFSTEMMTEDDGDDVLVIRVEDRDEFPVYITTDDSQILAMIHLWREAEVKTDTRTQMLELMTAMNLTMPLSSFSTVGTQYVIFGSASLQCSIDEMIEEVSVLSENALIAIEELKEYLN